MTPAEQAEYRRIVQRLEIDLALAQREHQEVRERQRLLSRNGYLASAAALRPEIDATGEALAHARKALSDFTRTGRQ